MKLRSGRGYASRAVSSRRSSGSVFGRVVRGVAPYVAQALANRIGGGMTQVTRDSGAGGPALTVQNDQNLRYRRRRMNRRRKKRWVRFVRRVNHVATAASPSNFYVNSSLGGVVTIAQDAQSTFAAMLASTTGSGGQDLLLGMFKAAYGSTLTSTTAAAYKLFCRTMVLDVQLCVTGAANVVVDVYELLCRKSYETGSTTAEAMYNTLYGQNKASPGGLGSTAVTSPANTVFSNPLFCQYWKVLSKRELLISAGVTSTLQLRIPRDKWMEGRIFLSYPLIVPGLTRCLFFQARGVPQNATGAKLSASEITWKAQLSGNYAFPPGSDYASVSTN